MATNRRQWKPTEHAEAFGINIKTILETIQFSLDLYFELLKHSPGHRWLAIHKKPFNYSEKCLSKKEAPNHINMSPEPRASSRAYQTSDRRSPEASPYLDQLTNANEDDFIIAEKLARVAGALEIQRIFRGYCKRKIYLSLANHNSWSIRTTMNSPADSFIQEEAKIPPLFTEKFIYRFNSYYNQYGYKQNTFLNYFDYAAIRIQACFRSFAKRKVVKRKQQQKQVGSTETSVEQSAIKAVPKPKRTEITAAETIQRTWKSYCRKATFRFLKSLIQRFQGIGDPKYLVKFINPREAALIDKAAGIHVRFRLGGEKFPPQIKYKIFTHRPTVDINSFSPRPNYALAEMIKKTLPEHFSWETDKEHILSLVEQITNGNDNLAIRYSEKWYSRTDGNEWRPISLKSLDPFEPSLLVQRQFDMQKRAEPFHFSSIKRKQDKEIERKQRRRQWLQKMYELGKEIEDMKSKESQIEENDEELIKWAQKVDFESYRKDWLFLGTSAISDNFEACVKPNEFSTIESSHFTTKSEAWENFFAEDEQ